MNVSIYDSVGLLVYRELMSRENRCAANWEVNYGPAALQKSPDPQTMMNLGTFAKFASVPMPLEVQLRELQRERKEHNTLIDTVEKKTFPKRSDAPVSQMSVDLWGDKAWHSQPKKAQGAAPTHRPFTAPNPRWAKRQWDVDGMQFVKETVGAAHVNSRLMAEGHFDGLKKPPPGIH